MNCYDAAASAEACWKAELSRQEAEDLVERELRCPRCNYMVGIAYSDCNSGHMKMKCQKCKNIWTLNMAYFCRRRYLRKYKVRRRSF